MAQELKTVLDDQAAKWLQASADVSSASVSLRATLDVSAPFIQGLIFYAQNPAQWSKAAFVHVTALFDPTVIRAYRVGNQEVIERMHREADVIFSSNDFYESANKGLLAKVPGRGIGSASVRRLLRHVRGHRAGRDVQGLEEGARKQGGTAISELGSFVNKASGVISTRGMGIGPTSAPSSVRSSSSPLGTPGHIWA